MTTTNSNGAALHLETTNRPGCARLNLAPRDSLRVSFPVHGPAPTVSGPLQSIWLDGDHLGYLSAAERHQVLRHCRHLLRPGGQLSLPVGPQAHEFPREGLGEMAWLTGFDAWVDFVAGCAVLTKPARDASNASLVNIVIPAYKSAYFAEALRSAQAQTWPRIEIVVCDDSPDGRIAEITQQDQGPHPVRYIRNPGNIGGRANYLQCYDVARGRYVKFLNDDDLLHPECVARMATTLDAHPSVTLVTSYRRLIDAEGTALPDEEWNRPVVSKDGVIDGRLLAQHVLSRKTNLIGEPTTVMFRKNDMAASQPHLMSYAGEPARRNGDMSIWSSLLSRGDAVYLVDALSEFRIHDAQVQKDPVFHAEAVQAWTELQDAARRTGLLDDDAAAEITSVDLLENRDQSVGEAMFQSGNAPYAATIFQRALRWRPTDIRARGNLACACWEAGQRQNALIECVLAHCCEPGDDTVSLNLQDMLAAGV
jgi:glycosyltransferase involved in cell wall biosynthesis